MTATSDMPLLERLRKGANCVVFLDGAPEPAADVADMLLKAADKIERQQTVLEKAKDYMNEQQPHEYAANVLAMIHGVLDSDEYVP